MNGEWRQVNAQNRIHFDPFTNVSSNNLIRKTKQNIHQTTAGELIIVLSIFFRIFLTLKALSSGMNYYFIITAVVANCKDKQDENCRTSTPSSISSSSGRGKGKNRSTFTWECYIDPSQFDQ